MKSKLQLLLASFAAVALIAATPELSATNQEKQAQILKMCA